ncbi:FecR domain-containing protein [Phenylobacterium sp. J426]|uniref:FecR family protein n=1 Tax=Phenylobacterium sp. J426 TaxID=2898439 RepID=UPI002150F4AE|nr:FecR domain-containing protein [Phenylobacterium sp. J426]MCR5875041.1 FecR domain-containing protein [Phenylobacterium sp. J426]
MATRNEEVMAQASAWLARLQRDEVSEADGLAFDAWLAAAPDHPEAYRAALAAWQAFDGCEAAVLDELAAEATRETRRAARRPGASRRWLIGGGMAIAAGLTAVAVLPTLDAPTVQTYATGKGQHERITLADGSVVDLNAESQLTVRFGRRAREVELGDGQAVFDVAHDAKRPFTIEASGRAVRVLGTQFDVRNRAGDVTVTVARGRVQVRPVASVQGGQAFVLTPGQRLAIRRTGAAELSDVDPQETLNWRSGRLVYRGEPLAEVVADLNREFVEQIEVTDPTLARMPVTGVIVLDDQASVAARLSLMLPVRSVPSERGLLLLRK